MKLTRLIFVICFLPVLNYSYAQDKLLHEAPSLQFGLGGLEFGEGMIDKKLVLEIIADKKLELRNQLIKSMLLDKIDGAGGTVYSYMDNLLNTLINEKSPEVQVKKALESSVNLGFVYAFANYYLHTLDEAEFANINKLAMASGCYLPTDYKDRAEPKSLHALVNDFYRAQSSNTQTFYEINNMKIAALLMDISAEVVNNNQPLKTLGLIGGVNNDSYLYLNQYLNLNTCPPDFSDYDLRRKYVTNTSLIKEIEELERSIDYHKELLNMKNENKNVELTFEKLAYDETCFTELSALDPASILPHITSIINLNNRKNEEEKRKIKTGKTLKEYLENEPLDEEKHKQIVKDQYDKLKFEIEVYKQNPSLAKRKVNGKIEKLNAQIAALKSDITVNVNAISRYRKCYADKIYADMSGKLNTLVNNIGFIWYLNDMANFTNFSTMKSQDLESMMFSGVNLDGIEFSDLVKKVKNDLIIFLNSADMNASQYRIVSETIKYLNKLENVDIENNELNRNSDILYQLNKHIIPLFIELLSVSSEIVSINDILNQMSNKLAMQLVAGETAMEHFDQTQIFFTLVGKLYQFSEASTYNDYLNVLADIGDIFPSDRVQTALNTTVSLLNDYLTFSEDNEKITVQFDVEACLINLSQIKYHRNRPFEFHFTVGANTVNFNKGINLEDDEVLKTYSFVGEKIGLKYIWLNWDYTSTFHKGETFEYHGHTYTRNVPAKKPTVSNLHFILYGSGLLYNLANTGTTADFNSPLLGVGSGLTFFNNLDLNLSLGVPLLDNNSFSDNFDHFYWNIGFDIQFTEYYDKVREKQRANKKQKQLLELKKPGLE